MARCWWIELPDFTGTISYALEDGGAVVEVAHVVRKDRGGGDGGAKAAGDRVSVWVRKAAIDLVAGHVEKEVETARIEADKISRLMVLHQEVAPGHYATSILAQPHGSRTDLGDGDTVLSRGPAFFTNCS
jgi:hypothetical protein